MKYKNKSAYELQKSLDIDREGSSYLTMRDAGTGSLGLRGIVTV